METKSEMKQMTQQTEHENYSQVVHHANVSASVSYVQRKTGLSYTLVGELMELALKNGDIAEGDYAGRKLDHYQDDRVAALQHALAECRDAFSIPSANSAEEDYWPSAIGDPESVPDYVRNRVKLMQSALEAKQAVQWPDANKQI